MNEVKLEALTAELRTSNTPSCQSLIALGDWRVIAENPVRVAATAVLDIATRHAVAAETNRAEFRGTKAQVQAALNAITNLAEKPSAVMDYVGDGTTDEWVVTVVSGRMYSIDGVISLASSNSVVAFTHRAEFR